MNMKSTKPLFGLVIFLDTWTEDGCSLNEAIGNKVISLGGM